MVPRLDIDALRALQAIVTHGGVTRAADHLALSQSAVSHKIKRLEENIQCELLNRRPGVPVLTDAGDRLLAYANRILSLHDEALLSLSKRSVSGNIRLGMTEDMTSSGLARILSRFTRLHPEVSVRTHVAQSMVLQREIERSETDIAVMQIFSRDVRPSDTVLYGDQLCWAKALDMRLTGDEPVPFLSYDDDCFYRNWMLEHVSSSGQPFKTVLECTSNAGIIAAIEAGLGVSIISSRHVSSQMEIIDTMFTAPPAITYVVRAAEKSTSTAVRTLANEISTEAGDIINLDAA